MDDARDHVFRVRQLQDDLAASDTVLARVTASNAQLVENMTTTQARCSALLEENRALRRRNRLLEQENEVLRRAAAYLSQANLPGK